jgi:hypothetical protein
VVVIPACRGTVLGHAENIFSLSFLGNAGSRGC